MRTYRKKGVIEAEPWTPAVDMTGVSVSGNDWPLEPGGMVARDPDNPQDRWYINPRYFRDNYEEVSEHDEPTD